MPVPEGRVHPAVLASEGWFNALYDDTVVDEPAQALRREAAQVLSSEQAFLSDDFGFNVLEGSGLQGVHALYQEFRRALGQATANRCKGAVGQARDDLETLQKALSDLTTWPLHAVGRVGEALQDLAMAQALSFKVLALEQRELRLGAIEHAQKAWSIAFEAGQPRLQAYALFEMVTLHCHAQEAALALVAASQLLRICQALPRGRALEGRAWLQLAHARHLSGMLLDALQAAMRSQTIFRELGLSGELTLALVAAAEIHLGRGRASKAMELAQNAVSISSAMPVVGGALGLRLESCARTTCWLARAMAGDADGALEEALNWVREPKNLQSEHATCMAFDSVAEMAMRTVGVRSGVEVDTGEEPSGVEVDTGQEPSGVEVDTGEEPSDSDSAAWVEENTCDWPSDSDGVASSEENDSSEWQPVRDAGADHGDTGEDGGRVRGKDFALDKVGDLLELGERLDFGQVVASAHRKFSRLYVMLGDFTKAVSALRDAVATYEHMGESTYVGDVCCEMADLYLYAHQVTRMSGALDRTSCLQAFFAGDDAWLSYQMSRARSHEGRAIMVKVRAKMCLGDDKSAVDLAEFARTIFQEMGDKREEGRALMAVSICQEMSGKHDEAAASAEAAAALFRGVHDKVLQARALIHVGNMLVLAHEPTKACRMALEVVTLATSCRNDGLACEGLLLRGTANFDAFVVGLRQGKMLQDGPLSAVNVLGDAQEAVEFAQNKLAHQSYESVALLFLADVLIAFAGMSAVCGESGEFNREEVLSAASDATTKAHMVYKDLKDEKGVAGALCAHAEITAMLDDTVGAVELIKQVMQLAVRDFAHFVERGAWSEIVPKPGFEVIFKRASAVWERNSGRQSSGGQRPAAGGGGAGGPPTLASAPASAPAPPQPRGPDPEHVRRMVVDVIYSSVSADFDAHQVMETPLMDLGMDSLAAVSVRNDLQRALDVRFPASVTFDYPTVNALVEHIVEEGAKT